MTRKEYEEQILVGDYVTIRDWDDMAEEYGVNSNGDIRCRLVFVQGMKQSCGKTYQVEKIGGLKHPVFYLKGDDSFCYSGDMFVVPEDNEPETLFLPPVPFDSLLGGAE